MPGLAASCAALCGLLLCCSALNVVAGGSNVLKLPTATDVAASWWRHVKAALNLVGNNKSADDERLAVFVKDNRAIDNMVLGKLLPDSVLSVVPPFMACWLRMFLLEIALYLGIGSIWCYYVYFCFGKECFGKGEIPTISDMLEQIRVAFRGMPWFALKDAVTELAVENGYTKAYSRLHETTLPKYFLNFCIYIIFTEFCVYWSHRLMHEIPYLYKKLHQDHHRFNKAGSLSPFAGIAHHPIDGLLQVGWYSVGLFLVPMHFTTHLAALIFAMMWTHCLHDSLDARIDPVMGSGFHTLHHVIYKDNYGQYFIYFDWLFGTLTAPEDFKSQQCPKSSPFETDLPETKGDKKDAVLTKKSVGKNPATPKSKKNRGLKRKSSLKRRNSTRKNRKR